jgi:excinuclease UvrABC nuclease subunit
MSMSRYNCRRTSGLHLIQEIRDEAHRFAITGHRAQRGKARKPSKLEDIPGVGPAKPQALLARFGGLQACAMPRSRNCAEVEGISRQTGRKDLQLHYTDHAFQPSHPADLAAHRR